MKKAVKILAWTLLGLLVLVLALVLTIPLWLGPTVATVANKVTPGYTGTRFSLENVNLNPYSGKFSLGPLRLGNPEGYPVPEAFSVALLSVDVEMTSLFSDTIHIRDITIDAPYASYVSLNGTNNFEWIGAHVSEKLGPSEDKAEDDKSSSKKKVVIDKLTISNTRVKLSVMPEMPIPTIVLSGIGKDKGGASWSEVGKMISDAVLQSSASLGAGLNSALGALGKGAGDIMGNATNVLGGAAGLLGGAATNAMDGVSKTLDGATKSLGDAAKSIGNLGGILGGSKEKGVKEQGNDAGGVIGAGKSVGNGALDAGKAVGNGALDAGKAVGNGALDAGKAVGNGAIDAGKAIGNGAKDAFKKVGNLFGK